MLEKTKTPHIRADEGWSKVEAVRALFLGIQDRCADL